MGNRMWWSGAGGYAAEILSVLAGQPDRVVLSWRDRQVTGQEFVEATGAAFTAMGEAKVGRDTAVGVLVEPNSPEMLVARYAANLRGATVCYLHTTNPGSNATMLSTADQLQVLTDTGAAVVYTDEQNLGRATDLADHADVSVLGPIAGSQGFDEPDDAEIWDPQRPAVIGYTAGSAGRPKGIRMSGAAWESSVRATRPPDQDGLVLLVNTPLSHTVGPMTDATLMVGGAVVLREEFQAGQFLRDVPEHTITRTFLATTHLYQLIDELEVSGRPDAAAGLASLRLLIYSGSAAAPARIARAARLIGPRLAQAYGTSEGGRITFLDPGAHFDPWLSTTVGRPFPEVEISLRDTESGAEVADGDTGQVWMRSPNQMDGYWGDDELTGRVLRDGWYATGDIGYRDNKGYLHLLGRMSDVVKVNGVKIHPTAVEAEVLALDGVENAAAYGWRDEDCVESLHCAVVFRPGAALTVDDVRTKIGDALSPTHVPGEFFVLDELPLNNAGKPDKVLLRSRHAARS